MQTLLINQLLTSPLIYCSVFSVVQNMSTQRTICITHLQILITNTYLQLHNNSALVQQGSSHPRNRTPMGVSILALGHFTMQYLKQFIVKMGFIPRTIYNVTLPYGCCSASWGCFSSFLYLISFCL